ncbi:MAG: hypothetical protein ALAOOOJD_04378 [bacterium]|nr:hypothetical protein [bacterium]
MRAHQAAKLGIRLIFQKILILAQTRIAAVGAVAVGDLIAQDATHAHLLQCLTNNSK